MYAIIHNDHDCFEFLPSISVQRCFGKLFLYIALFTFALEIGPGNIQDFEE